mgnify:FL=1
MRTLMMAVSLLLLGAGTFCVANANVAFSSTAFVVGIAFCITGAVEVLVARNTSINEDRGDVSFPLSGLIFLLLGTSILTGVIKEDYTVTAIMAFVLARDGFIDVVSVSRDVKENNLEDNATLAIGIVECILAIYMLYNTVLFKLPLQMLIGAAIVLMAVTRFRAAIMIKRSRNIGLSGQAERLYEAEMDEKAGMAKAKEGIKEAKEARQRAEAIREEMERERKNIAETSARASYIKEEDDYL